jgi:hypothetical protein
MAARLTSLLAIAALCLAGCAQTDTAEYTPPEKGDPGYLKGKNTRADAVYVNASAEPGGRDFRNVYVEPADLSNIRIIQPEGAEADAEWTIRDLENDILQKAIVQEFSQTLGYQSAYNIVDNREQAEILVHTTVVAIHPYATRAEEAAGAKAGGAITASIALVNAKTGTVMVRSVDTKSTDNIWAFHQVDNDDPAYNLIFRAWGNSIRRGMLQLQGRSTDPLAQPVLMKKQ